jgi:hypothetical protein
MIFKTVNAKIEKTAYDIDIKNIDLATGHWGSEKKIVDFLDTVENFTYDKETLNKNLILHALKFMKGNLRVKDVKFYRIPEENKIVLLAITNVPKFKEFETLSREMTISFKKDRFAFSIVELLSEELEEIKEGKKALPESWKADDQLTDRFNKLKHYA